MVVVFTHDDIEYVSAAPRQWLREKENVFFCMWPKSKLIERKAIKLCMKPEEDWVMYQVQVVGYFATLKEALDREISKQNSTSSESEVNKLKGKRKITKTAKYRDDSISPPPKINEEASDGRNPPVQSHPSNENTESNFITPVTMLNVADASPETSSENLESQFRVNAFPSESDIINADIVLSDEVTSLNSCQSVCKSGDIYKELKEIKSFITFIMRKVETIELSLTRINVPSEPKATTLLPHFPLAQINEVKALEDMLGDEDVRTELFDMLRHTGGSKERDCVNRCLEKIFSDYLGQYCSWTGKKSNFKLASLTLMIVIKRAVRQTFPNVSDESFERHVMNWFQHAGTRLKRRNQ